MVHAGGYYPSAILAKYVERGLLAYRRDAAIRERPYVLLASFQTGLRCLKTRAITLPPAPLVNLTCTGYLRLGQCTLALVLSPRCLLADWA